MSKKLCEIKKLLKKDFEAFARHVNNPTHCCKNCGRVANDKKLLCKPRKLPEDS